MATTYPGQSYPGQYYQGTTSTAYQVVDAGGIASAEAFGADTFGSHLPVVDAGGISSGEAFGADTFSSHLAINDAGGIVSAEAFGQPTVTAVSAPSQQSLGGGGTPRRPHAPQLVQHTPFVVPKWVTVVGAGGIESAEAFGLPRVIARRDEQRRRREEELLAA